MKIVLSFFLLVSVFPQAVLAEVVNCSGTVFALPPQRSVVENRPIRLENEVQRANYGRALLAKADQLHSEIDTQYVANRVRLSSLYWSILNDPVSLQRYFSTGRQIERANALRQKFYGITRPGTAGYRVAADEIDATKNLLDDQTLQRLLSGNWLSEFPSIIINQSADGPFRELLILENNTGDFLTAERAVDKASLMATGDAALAFQLYLVSRTGGSQKIGFGSMVEALYYIQTNKTNICAAHLYINRYWFHRPYVEKYADYDVTSNSHLLGQVKIWERSVSNDLRDWSVHPFVKKAFFVSGFWFSIHGDRVLLARTTLEPLVASQN